MPTFTTPEIGKDLKLVISGDDARELFTAQATRTWKFVKEDILKRIWQKHDLPMYRGTIVDNIVPFEVRISQVLWQYRDQKIGIVYDFRSTD